MAQGSDATASSNSFGVRSLSKAFDDQLALDSVDLDFHGGEIHAIAGHNGSGKSTLIRLLAGFYRPEPGASFVTDGHTDRWQHGREAARDRLRFVHQDLALIGDLSAADNLALASDARRSGVGRTSRRAEYDDARAALDLLGITLDVSAKVADLSPVERTMLAVARACHGMEPAHTLLVLDEPTATLPIHEVETLFALIRRLAASGAAIILVTHALDEMLQLADTISVLRDGVLTGSHARAEITREDLVRAITGVSSVGDDLAAPVPERDGAPALSVKALSGLGLARVDLELHPGEVVGVAGLDGSGRERLAAAIAGADPTVTGVAESFGEPLPLGSLRRLQRRGIAFVPGDRANLAVVPDLTAAENLTLSRPPQRRRSIALDRRRERSDVRTWLEKFEVSPPRPDRLLGAFSGGNQQKIVVARSLYLAPALLLLDEPTQGVDVGAKRALYRIMRSAASDGTAILICSSDLEELAEVCDRVIVMIAGSVACELTGAALTSSNLLRATLQESQGELPKVVTS